MTSSRKDVVHMRERLQEAGLRVTLPRLHILETLETLSGHQSIDNLYEALKSQEVQLPRASLYNAMHTFVQAGLVQMLVTKEHTLYEIAQEWHSHFICRRCNTVIDIYSEQPNPAQFEIEDIDQSEIEDIRIVLYGLCPACRPKTGG